MEETNALSLLIYFHVASLPIRISFMLGSEIKRFAEHMHIISTTLLKKIIGHSFCNVSDIKVCHVKSIF